MSQRILFKVQFWLTDQVNTEETSDLPYTISTRNLTTPDMITRQGRLIAMRMFTLSSGSLA